jgi:hypothetical protein
MVQDFESLKITVAALSKQQEQAKYSVLSEHDCGSLICKDLEAGDLEKYVPSSCQDLKIAPVKLSELQHEGAGEDAMINRPMSSILNHRTLISSTVQFTGTSCPLADSRGRGQRADTSFFTYVLEWPCVITMIEGKLDFKMTNFKDALGQAARRAWALLDMQPWREFVVIIIHCITQVVFFYMEQNNRGKPRISDQYECLVTTGEVVVMGEGFRILMNLMNNPSLLGFLRCPVSVTGAAELGVVGAICARSHSKAVFLCEQEGVRSVLKVFQKRAHAQHEHRVLSKLSQVDGVIRLLNLEDPMDISIQVLPSEDTEMWFGLSLGPYCDVLSNVTASPALFADYAFALKTAADLECYHNDVSPDNLLVTTDSCPRGVVTDWEHAGSNGLPFRRSAKLAFAPTARVRSNESGSNSLIADLESLCYVAVACTSKYGASWMHEKDSDKMVLARNKASHIYQSHSLRNSSFEPEWQYLDAVGEALMSGEEIKVYDAFMSVRTSVIGI